MVGGCTLYMCVILCVSFLLFRPSFPLSLPLSLSPPLPPPPPPPSPSLPLSLADWVWFLSTGGVDPNPANYVSAGVINTSTILIGCLLRLEPNTDSKVHTHTHTHAHTHTHTHTHTHARTHTHTHTPHISSVIRCSLSSSSDVSSHSTYL